MKNLIFIFILLITSLSYGQEEIKMPELDTSNKVYTLEFSPDIQNEQVISAYMQGTTEKDSLRFWAEGTILVQNIMVTILSPDKKAKIKVDLVKNHWEDSKISGQLKEGVFQETFDTSNKFGIVITSDTPNTPYYLAVWTSGELIPDMGTLYYNASNENTTSDKNNSTLINSFETNSTKSGTNFFMFAIIGILAIIASFLGFMVFKKRKGTTLFILIFIFAGQEILNAQSQSLSSVMFNDILQDYSTARTLANYEREFREAGDRRSRRRFDPIRDADEEADVNPAGSPRLPSSCIPSQFQNNRDEQETPSGRDERDEGDGDSGSDRNSILNGDSGSDENHGNNEGNESDSEDGKYDDSGRPKYDRDGRPINYDNSKYPKYDKNGNPINYDDIDSKGNFDSQGRPRFDKNKKPIEYDNRDRPKYDSKGNPINYNPDDFVNPPKRNKDSGFPVNDKENPEKGKKNSSILNSTSMNLDLEKEYVLNISSINVNEHKDSTIPIKFAQANMFPSMSISLLNDSDSEEGCKCLEREYKNLNDRRLNLERLRIIYAHAMKKIRAGIAFGDNVSGVHGVSGLAWQSQKMIILKESIPTLNKAYDDKYAEMIESLEDNLLEIERCEKLLGYENWYNHAGFIYYQFMADKYKRN